MKYRIRYKVLGKDLPTNKGLEPNHIRYNRPNFWAEITRKEKPKMQRIAEETKVISVNLTMDQYQWLLTQADKRELSAFIRSLIDDAKASQSLEIEDALPESSEWVAT